MSWKPVEPKDYFKYKCPKCSNYITSILGDKGPYVVCEKCNNFFHNNSGQLTFVAHFKKTFLPVFKVGITGTYKSKKFQLIGIIEVKEDKTSYYWDEYIVKYEDETIAYFMQYDGHWSYVEQLPHSIKSTQSGDIFYEEEQYTYFNSYRSVNVSAVGSFFWNITDNDKPRIREYINPPYGLISEHKKTHINWYKSEYIEPSKLKTIFDGDKNRSLPSRKGVYSIQPAPLAVQKNSLTEISFFYLLFMLITFGVLVYLSNENTVFDMQQSLNHGYAASEVKTDSSNTHPERLSEISDRGIYYPDSNVFVSDPFKISSTFNSTALDVSLNAPVNNNWFEASCQMINETTGQEYFFEIGVEYYSGPDWTEGSTDNSITLSEIPDGTYRIMIKPYPGSEGFVQLPHYRLTIVEGTPLWSNLFIFLLAGLSVPVGMIIYVNNFNASRWHNSNLTQ